MNLLLFEAAELEGDRLRLADRRHRHLVEVLRAAPGDRVRVGQVGGLTGIGQILELDAHKAVLRVELDAPPPPPLPWVLILALPRPKMLGRILQAAASFGVEAIHLIHSARVEKSYWQSPKLAPRALRAELLLGLEQAGDTRLPELHCHRRFASFAGEVLPALAARRRALIAHPEAAAPCPAALSDPLALAVGPEGGFLPEEVARFAAAGFSPVTLGPRVLRVETAVAALLGRLLPPEF